MSVFKYAYGATPLDPDEIDGLIPDHITTQGQLNVWEQSNILEAEKWIGRQNFKRSEVACVEFIKKLHQRMFSKTWRWAGEFRKSNKNIGVDWSSIPVSLKLLTDDLCYQLEHQVYSMDELVARFHHRLVAIHLFPNGNGRHARLMADIILLSQGHKRFSWGSAGELIAPSSVRNTYIFALREADKMNYEPLIDFVRK